MSRYDRPTDPARPEPATPLRHQIPEWSDTVEDQQPTEQERETGRFGIRAARAALKAAHRPVNASSLAAWNEQKEPRA